MRERSTATWKTSDWNIAKKIWDDENRPDRISAAINFTSRQLTLTLKSEAGESPGEVTKMLEAYIEKVKMG